MMISRIDKVVNQVEIFEHFDEGLALFGIHLAALDELADSSDWRNSCGIRIQQVMDFAERAADENHVLLDVVPKSKLTEDKRERPAERNTVEIDRNPRVQRLLGLFESDGVDVDRQPLGELRRSGRGLDVLQYGVKRCLFGKVHRNRFVQRPENRQRLRVFVDLARRVNPDYSLIH